MNLKTRFKQCFQILFKGRDMESELQLLEKKLSDAKEEYEMELEAPRELAKKMRARLEMMIGSAKPAVLVDANSMSNVRKIPVYETYIDTSGGMSPHIYPRDMEIHYLDLQRVNEGYCFTCRPEEVESRLDYFYERAAHEFAELLMNRNLLRMTAFRHHEDPYLVTLRFEALYCGNK